MISVWAYDSGGNWTWVDGVCERQTMDTTIDDLFRLVQEYSPQGVGVEVTGQRGGFIQWIQREMGYRGDSFYGLYLQKCNDDTINNSSSTSELTDEDTRFYDRGFV